MYWMMLPFVLLACVYCADAWRGGKYSHLLKPLLMPVLLAGYIAAAHPVQGLVIAGLAMGFVGDVALMRKGDKAFIVGLGAFLLGHLMYAIWFVQRMGGMPGAWTLGYIALAIAAGVLLYRHLKPGLGDMKPAVILYEAVILVMSVAAFALMLARPGWASALRWLGSVSFIVSDSVLAHGIFLGERPRGHFAVMSTYTLAQMLIALGAAMM